MFRTTIAVILATGLLVNCLATEKAHAIDHLGAENIFPSEAQYFTSTEKAVEVANTWINTEK